ncbi:hypothetical protein D9619_005307 [Psilocybe cf. subviscida]|uniref:Presequence translocated-associated motor subunit PAM17 n=1 Tax=Psilocybe cf. subviscida TaxID=2480587 RepID=A0A8H5BWU8_9AGAR|nr:hypothetical protein D9619_005307 [Psilocybe cf. subviscida]
MQSSLARGTRPLQRSSLFTSKPPTKILTRAKSTAAEANPVSTATSTAPAATEKLTWPQFLNIKRKKRTWQTAATIPCALLGFAGGAAYFGSLETDPLKPIMGIDPFFFYGFCTVGCVGAGALVGPTIGGSLWRYTHRRIVPQLDAKEREFFQRITKNRVDVSLQNPTSPVPDYYGEKIGSLHQYRQWLRDQNKYRRKALLPEE